MSGRRCKALRREFIRRFGRPPEGMSITKQRKDGAYAYTPSEWRRVKKEYNIWRRVR